MKILIIAQNLFIARLLVSLAENHSSIDSYKVVVFSSIEKFILERIHGVPGSNIICPKEISGVHSFRIYVDCIEGKRGSLSHKAIEKLQSRLITILNLQDNSNLDYVWIFNKYTFIGACLHEYKEYSEKCIVFENSNKNDGVTIYGDMHFNDGKALRKKFLDPMLFRKAIPNLCCPKAYRWLTFLLHTRSIRGIIYYIKRISTRLINIVIFSLLAFFRNFIFSTSRSKPYALIALQIKDDSSIAMHADFDTYSEMLISKAVEIKTKNPEINIVVRPHPLDYTFGWLSFFLKARRSFPSVRLDLSDLHKHDNPNLKYLINFNSNIVRNTFFKNRGIQIITLCKTQLLPSFNSDLFQIHQHSLRTKK